MTTKQLARVIILTANIVKAWVGIFAITTFIVTGLVGFNVIDVSGVPINPIFLCLFVLIYIACLLTSIASYVEQLVVIVAITTKRQINAEYQEVINGLDTNDRSGPNTPASGRAGA